MKKDKHDINHFAFADTASQRKRFWLRTFLIYAGIEIIILSIQYFITWKQCHYCVLPGGFYIVNWLQHLVFTGLVWLILYKCYKWGIGRTILLNIVVFTAYYFLWLGLTFLILNSGQEWLAGNKTSLTPFRNLIYSSWGEIGKYVLKLSAFYVLQFYIEYRIAERQRIQLAVINKDMQLNLLKQQLSPHFYFNTLNNLYGLARSNNEKLTIALHQLSNIMRYVIVDCNQPKVLLNQEINFLQSYIALEKLRYEKNTVIEMEVKGEAGQLEILPLVLIQFVENAFKHGMKEKSDKNWMKVSLAIVGNELLFSVNNSFYAAAATQGIGIHSVKNILELQYEGRHHLEMIHEAHRFSVTLKLSL